MRVKRTVLAVAAALTLAGCGTTETPPPAAAEPPPTTATDAATTTPRATTSPKPATPVIDWTSQRDGYAIDVRIVANYAADQLPIVLETIQDRTTEIGGYFVQIRCDSTDVVLANGKFAVGPLGAAQTGLSVGEREFEPRAGTTCEL